MPPRRRAKTRVDNLVDAMRALDKATNSLQEIDLRTTTGELRRLVKESRSGAAELSATLAAAVRADEPVNPLVKPTKTVRAAHT